MYSRGVPAAVFLFVGCGLPGGRGVGVWGFPPRQASNDEVKLTCHVLDLSSRAVVGGMHHLLRVSCVHLCFVCCRWSS